MALSIKNPEADRLARELAELTGEGLTEAVIKALEERLRRERGTVYPVPVREQLAVIRERCSSLPVLDKRREDEIIEYDDRGAPR